MMFFTYQKKKKAADPFSPIKSLNNSTLDMSLKLMTFFYLHVTEIKPSALRMSLTYSVVWHLCGSIASNRKAGTNNKAE